MLHRIQDIPMVKRTTKTMLYTRLRQYFPMREPEYIDDQEKLEPAEIILIDWPRGYRKPRFGIAQDYGPYPRWTKYRRFLTNNGFEYAIYNIHASDWIQKADDLDIIAGFISSEAWDLQEMREKYFFLEATLGKRTYPSPGHVNLYESKTLEAYISQFGNLPFAPTCISHDKEDALRRIEDLRYPLVSKIVPASGSMGVELIHDIAHARKILSQVFSPSGRKTHHVAFRQKNYVYFQEFVPNDGYDIRVIVVGNWLFGYYRKALDGDFRASGMNQVEKRALPEEAMRIAIRMNEVVKSPMLVVDLVHALDGRYYVIEFSPVCQMEFPEQLKINGTPGVYIYRGGCFHFQSGRFWVHELALREFLLRDYLPVVGQATSA